jgi:TolB-like protein/Tfp pilus assembly protein PilF
VIDITSATVSTQEKHLYEFGPFCLDTAERRLLRDGEVVPLAPKVFDLLLVLVQHSGHLIEKEELLREGWPNQFVEEGNLPLNISILRKALGEDRTSREYIETVPKRGYRFVADVRQVEVGVNRSVAEKPTIGAITLREKAGTHSSAIDSLAVLPFVNVSADPGTEYLSDGITESVINSLSRLRRLRVMARSTVFRYKGREVDAEEVGRELKVGAVLLGRLLHFGDHLIIRTELVEVGSGCQLWGEQYNRKLTDILAVQGEIATEISEKLRLRLTEREQSILTKRYTEKTEAYQAYLQGRYFWDKRTEESLNKAIEYFRQAIDMDQNYALAHAGLADCYAVLGNFSFLTPKDSYPKAKTAAIKALEIDDRMAEAHTSLAWIKAQYDWDWPGAERKFKRANELNPGYTPARYWYALFLSAMGRHEEAVAEGRRAQEIEPLSLVPNIALGFTLLFARQDAEAVEQLRTTTEMEPNFSWPRWLLGWAYGQKEMYGEAIAELNVAVSGTGSRTLSLSMLGHGYAISGRRAEALAVLAELQETGKRKYVAPFFMALIYAGLGESERAFEWLEKAYECRSWGLLWLKVDPRLDSLRSDERFTSLLRRIGLEP